MVEYNSSLNDKKRTFLKIKEKNINDITKNSINKKILFILFIFFIKIQIYICDNPVITLKIQSGVNSIIYKDFKNYISEVYINDTNMENIETSYNFTQNGTIVKIILNSQITNFNKMFMDCKYITEISFSNFDSSNINKFSEVFKNCERLISINLSDWDISKVTQISSLFDNCKKLTSIELPDFTKSEINAMNSLFSNCNQLKSIDLSRIDTSKVTNMKYLFNNCGKLTSLDLSNFDTSNAENMAYMFSNCGQLTSLNLSNFNTSKVTNMAYMFRSCHKLTTLDLSNFDTSNVIDCSYMFYDNKFKSIDLSNFNTSKVKTVEAMFLNCQQLTSLDLSNFDTSQVTNMKEFLKECRAMAYLNISNFNTSSCTNMDRTFSHCASLTSLDLTHFDTSKVTNMHKMFSECFKLVDLNISNFNTSKVEIMDYMFSNGFLLTSLDLSSFTMESIKDITYMFNNTPKLEFINLSNSKPNDNIKISNIFIGTSKNLVICSESEIISRQINIDCNVITCSDNWREYQAKINIDNNQCVINCSILNNKFEYLSKCVNTCPDPLYMDESQSKCVDTCPNSTYINGKNCEKCHPDCKECNGPFNDSNSNCSSCLSPDKYLENGNCIYKEINDYTTNEIYIETTKDITTTLTANLTNDIATQIETTILNCNNISSLYNINYNIIKECLLPLYNPENDFELIREGENDIIFQITTSKNQLQALNDNSLNNYNLSIIDLGNCETILKEKFNLNENDDLILLKKEKKSNKASEKEVQLEIYEPYSKSKLNISICENTNINIYVKAKLSDEIKYSYEKLKSLGYDMFNVNEPFYQDICIDYTSYKDTDIILSDRINYIYNNDEIKCQSNCKLSIFSEESEYLNCSCIINEDINNMNEKFKSTKVYESFSNDMKYSAYKVLKCYNLVFTKYLITKNIGGILVFTFILIYLGCFVIYIIKRINPLKNKFQLKFENKYNNNNVINNINNNDIMLSSKIDIFTNNKNNKKSSNVVNPPRRKSNIQLLNINNILNENDNDNVKTNANVNKNDAKLVNIIKKKKIITIRRQNKINTIINQTSKIYFEKMKQTNIKDNTNNKFEIFYDKVSKNSNRNNENKNEIEVKEEELDNLELNELDYEEAIQLDKRSFIQIYWGILKREQPIIFTFFIFDDYNLIYIKLIRFIFLLVTDMVMNVFFFPDETIHKLYLTNGKYDFSQNISQIIYSIIISKLIEILLCYLSLTDKLIYKVKNLMFNNFSMKAKDIFKCITIKLIIFLVFTFIFILFYWYTISAFCAVYKNSQTIFILDWMFTSLFGFLIPFILYLIPSGLRICSLKKQNWKSSIYIYKLSKFIPIF